MRRRHERGSAVVEAALLMPILFVLFFMVFWGGEMMYVWTGVNYAAMSAAVDAARKGEFSTDIRSATAQYLQQWTPGGKVLGADINASAPYNDPGKVVVWGPDVGSKIQRGNNLTVGVVYPFKVDSPLLGLLGRAVFGGDVIYLKASATAKSEVFIE
ncbi:TadE/TadG family type IV pilus assembly protein [Neomoorella thermoacetica]|uniref:TadE/TadG family type IV pilus assembly protein n=1 Tax=Neomoorella thermoacetica TaxID=1525 RepID=UPI0030D08980